VNALAEKDLGYRRVQSTGRGSYIISLPKEWVEDIVKRGSEIAFNIQPDQTSRWFPENHGKGRRDTRNKPKEYYKHRSKEPAHQPLA
jgi:phosphate uptake regulator